MVDQQIRVGMAFSSRDLACRVAHEGLSSMAGGFAFAASAIGVFNILRDGNLSIVCFNFTLALIFAAIWWAWGQGKISAWQANRIVAAMVALALSNVLFTFTIRGELLQANIAALIVLVAGSVLLSVRWLSLCLLLITVAWTAIAWKVIPSSEELIQSCATVWVAAMLSAVIHSARQRTHHRLATALLKSQTAEEHLEDLVKQRTARLSDVIIRLEREIRERERAEEQRRQLESQFEQTQKLESLGVVAGGVAHDFNNLLVGMLGNVGLARNQLPEDSTCHPFLECVATAAQRAAELTRQMLVYAGQGKFVFEACYLPELVEEMASLLTLSMSKKASFELSYEGNLPPIHADATQIRQVVMNLITNASDALGDEEGNITIRIEGPSKEDSPSQHRVLLEVSDSGCGMDETTKKKIFDPFFTTKLAGRGLGMAAVSGIVRSHQGEIHIHSEPGCGTIFRIFIPVWQERAESAISQEIFLQEPDPVNPSSRSATILIVDDEYTVRTVMSACLESAGFKVLTARDGIQAIEIFKKQTSEIDLVILDLAMPRLGGEQTLLQLRHIQPGLPVVFSTGFSDEENRWVGDELTDFLEKPFPPETLLRKIHENLAAHKLAA